MPMENIIASKDVNFDAPPSGNTGGTPETDQLSQYILISVDGSQFRLPESFLKFVSPDQFLKYLPAPKDGAFIDTVSVTAKSKNYYKAFPNSPAITSDGEDLVEDISKHLEDILGFGVSSKLLKSKSRFYTHCYELGSNWGYLAIGGQHQRDSFQIYLYGHGCMMATEGWGQRLKDFIEKIDGEITRADAAADIFDGSYSVEQAKEDHLKGLFKLKNAPQNPSGESRGCWDYKALGIKNKGLSYYIGERASSKYLRVYQKGYEQGKRLKGSKEYGEFFEKELSGWVRIEAEFKNSDRKIPTDILINPAQYLAGFAPALEFLSTEQSVIKIRKKTFKTTVLTVKHWIKEQLGKSLYGILLAECANEHGVLEITDEKIVTLFKSLMIEQTPKWLKTYKEPEPMDFTSPDAQKDYETEDDFIDRTLRDIGIIGKKLEPKTDYQNKERNFYESDNGDYDGYGLAPS